MSDIVCPLCTSLANDYCKDKIRDYFQCQNCSLVFVLPKYFLDLQEEKRQYDFHENDSSDVGYRNFLSRMSNPMLELLSVGDRGLDFGSGPGPTLSLMFEEQDHPMQIYDPFYASDDSVLNLKYDFITATEVIEHFQNPIKSLNKMWDCLKPGGYLGIMTKLVIDKSAFTNWHYKNDPTHICFFSIKTFDWIISHWKSKVVFRENDLIIMQKQLVNT